MSCGQNMVIKQAFRQVPGMSGLSECKNTKPILEIGVECPKCKGRWSNGAVNGDAPLWLQQHPECHFTMWNRPTGQRCPECGNSW